MRSEVNLESLKQLAQQLNCKCSVMRAALETHVRAEENELWPLFVENFTEEEQHELVGSVIGRTGAEVLQAMLPWVSGRELLSWKRAFADFSVQLWWVFGPLAGSMNRFFLSFSL